MKAEGLDKNFLFLPYQDKKDIPYSMTACDVSLVSVSEGMESLVAPSKLYPALAAGRPIAVICPNGNYLEELVTSSNCGSAFRSGDSEGLSNFFHKLLSKRQLTQEMGYDARRKLEQDFTPQAIGDSYFTVLQHSNRY